MDSLLKNKWGWIIGVGVVFIIIFAIVRVGEEKSGLGNKESEIIPQKTLTRRLENCLQEADVWFAQAKQTTIEILEEEKRRYNLNQEFLDQQDMGLDSIMPFLLEELEDYKTECYKKHSQQ